MGVQLGHGALEHLERAAQQLGDAVASACPVELLYLLERERKQTPNLCA